MTEAWPLAPFFSDFRAESSGSVFLKAPDRPDSTRRSLRLFLEKIGADLVGLGVGGRTRIATVLPDGAEAIVSFLAVSRVAVAVPVNPVETRSFYSRYFQEAQVSLVIWSSELPEIARDVAQELEIPVIVLSPDPSLRAGEFKLTLPPAAIALTDAAGPTDGARINLILPTSGSSGQVKRVLISVQNLMPAAHETARSLELTSEDCEILVTPIFHAHGLVSGILLPLISGGSIFCPGKFRPDEWIGWMRKYRPNWYTVAPAIHREIIRLLESLDPKNCEKICSSLRFVRSGAAPFEKSYLRKMETLLSVPVIEAYGLSESPHASGNPLNAARLGSVGRRVGPEIAILDKKGKAVPRGISGEIALRGSNVFGYDDASSLTEASTRSGWFRTGDLGRFDAECYLYIEGRKNEIINRGGVKIMPLEVDRSLGSHPSLLNAQSFAIPHETLGEDLVAAVIARPGEAENESGLRNHVRAGLGAAKTPSRIIFVDEFPSGATGKILRRACREAFQDRLSEAYGKPEGDKEEKIAAIFSEILERSEVGRNDHFFLLGGDSLRAARCISRLQQVLSRSLKVSLLFEYPSVRDLARAIDTIPEWVTTTNSPESNQIGKASILSYNEMRLAFLEKMEPGKRRYHLPSLWEIREPATPDQIKSILEEIILSHRPLSSGILEKDGEFQKVDLAVAQFEFSLSDWREIPSCSYEWKLEGLIEEEMRRPFDLGRDLKMRSQLIKLSENKSLLFVMMHHVACDGWSMKVFESELTRLMRESRKGGPSRPANPTKSYRDHAALQRLALEGGQYRDGLEIWKTSLKGVPSLDLPSDRCDPEIANDLAINSEFKIDGALAERLEEIAKANGATLQMITLCAAHILLARWSGQDDFAIGVPVAGRHGEDYEKLIGFFANTLAIRNSTRGNPTLKEFLQGVREASLTAYDHQEIPFDLVVREVTPDRRASELPLVQVVFQLIDFADDHAALEQPAIIRKSLPPPSVRFDLEFLITRDRGSGDHPWHGLITGKKSRHSKVTIRRVADTYLQLLREIAGNAHLPVNDYPLLLERDRDLIKSWNTSHRVLPNASLAMLFKQVTERFPERRAMQSPKVTLTYADVLSRVNFLIHELKEQGVRKGSMVGVFLEKSERLPISFLAILWLGGIYLPLDPADPVDQIEYVLGDSETCLLIVDNETRSIIPSNLVRVYCLPDSSLWNPPVTLINPEPVSSDDPAYLMYTSGSTGKPKGVLIPHRGIIRLVVESDYLSISPDDCFLHLASPSFDAATFEIWGPLLNGATLVIPPAGLISLGEMGELISKNKVSILWLTAGLFHLVVDEALDALAPVKTLLAGGDVLSPAHVGRCRTRYPDLDFINGYGPTENTTFSCCHRVNGSSYGDSVPIGRPIGNSGAYILDEKKRLCPPGVTGELVVTGDGLALGYWKDPTRTLEKFTELELEGAAVPAYLTGDLARWTNDGTILFIGRRDRQVKVRGYRIEPNHIQSVLESHPKVRQSLVISPDGSTLVAFVILKEEESFTVLGQFLRERLPAWMIPSRWHQCETFPLTRNGKIDHLSLPLECETTSPRIQATENPEDFSDAQITIRSCWQEVLPGREIGPTSNFFELGGHSLQAMRLISLLEKSLGRKVALSSLFAHPIFLDFCQAIKKDEAAQTSPLIKLSSGTSGKNLIIAHGWGGELFAFDLLRKALPPELNVYALKAREHCGGSRSESFPEMCGDYADEILKAGLEGPVALCGYSLGGLVAFETARRLKEAGREIDSVVVIDTHPNNLPIFIHLLSLLPHFLSQSKHHLQTFLFGRSKRAFLRGRMTALQNHLRKGGRKEKEASHGIQEVTLPETDHYHRLFLRFDPRPAPVSVILVQSTKGNVGLNVRWRYLCRGKYRRIPSNLLHKDLLNEQGSSDIAKIISDYLNLQNPNQLLKL